MNTYRHSFTCACPVNDKPIFYTLEIKNFTVIHVEDIVSSCGEFEKDFHEEIADRLHEIFGGVQILKAHHHGVDIETTRGRI